MSTIIQTLATNWLLLAVIILAIICLVLLAIVINMQRKMRRFLVGFDSENIGNSLSFVSNELNDLQKYRKELEAYLTQVEKRLKKSVQAVHTVRFNPFKGSGDGGNQSFATAFLAEDGNGVIISSIHSRDHVRVFSKPIKNTRSEFELSDEEREAIEKANDKLK